MGILGVSGKSVHRNPFQDSATVEVQRLTLPKEIYEGGRHEPFLSCLEDNGFGSQRRWDTARQYTDLPNLSGVWDSDLAAGGDCKARLLHQAKVSGALRGGHTGVCWRRWRDPLSCVLFHGFSADGFVVEPRTLGRWLPELWIATDQFKVFREERCTASEKLGGW